MEKPLFSVQCTTCRAALGVRDPAVVGTIVECPKCGSFVEVVPPKGWIAPTAKKDVSPVVAAVPPVGSPEKTPLEKAIGEPAKAKAGSAANAPASVAKPKSAPPVAATAAGISAPPVSAEALAARTVPSTPPVPPVAAAKPVVPPVPVPPEPLPQLPAQAAEVAPVAGVSPLTKVAIALSATAVVLLIVAFASYLRQPQLPADEPPTEVAVNIPVENPVEPKHLAVVAAPVALDRRWIPNTTTLIFSVHPAACLTNSGASRWIEQFGGTWRQTFGAVQRALGLKLDSIRRLTLVSTDLSAWPEKSVVLIELAEGQDATVLRQVGEPAGFSLGEVPCRRLAKGDWQHPLAVIDAHTIVTGDEALMRHLAQRKEPEIASLPMSRLLKAVTPDADATLLVDLSAARTANWKMPGNLFDIWPAGRTAWRTIWDLAEGLGCMVRCTGQAGAELALVCEGDSAAEKVYHAIGELVPAAKQSLGASVAAIAEKKAAGTLDAPTAAQYEHLLKQMLASLDALQYEVNHGVVWCRAGGMADAAGLLAASAESRGVIEADWLASARTTDEATLAKLMQALMAYQKAEGKFPPGAVGGALMDPETRLSWIATLLPYLGHADWHSKLERGYSWNASQNKPITAQALPEVINPALGPSSTAAGFPVTHYVGVAGVGADAASLPASDPRAGVFGYGRQMRPSDIADGASNTIAVLGVSGKLGPWAAGGQPSVRPLTKAPYVNGPDGFGSGQPDGMLAGMADGSVRFIAKDVDPTVIEQLATAGGREKATVAALDRGPRQPIRKPELDAGAVKPETPEPEPAPVSSEALKARLGMPVPAITFTDAPLGRVVATVAAMGGVVVCFDSDALVDMGISMSDPVSIKLESSSVGKALQTTVASRGFTCVLDGDHVLVTGRPEFRQTLAPWRQPVVDLASGGKAATADLAAVIERLVSPESWKSRGGRGTILAEAGALFGEQTPAVARRVASFLERLRLVRKKPLMGAEELESSGLAPRLARAKEALDRPITVNFRDPAPLGEVVALLENLGQVTILVDGAAANAVKLTTKTPGTLVVDKQPLGEALDALVGPLGLAWRVVDGDLLEITTSKMANSRLDLEFYPVASLLASRNSTPDALIERIQTEAAPASWSDTGGVGVIYFDKPSGCLVILQSQKVHAEIAGILAEKR